MTVILFDQIEWLKDGVPVNEDHVNVQRKHGVCSAEIYSCKIRDAGKYEVRATNPLGEAQTDCILTIQGWV